MIIIISSINRAYEKFIKAWVYLGTNTGTYAKKKICLQSSRAQVRDHRSIITLEGSQKNYSGNHTNVIGISGGNIHTI